jgi:hypothetical protein
VADPSHDAILIVAPAIPVACATSIGLHVQQRPMEFVAAWPYLETEKSCDLNGRLVLSHQAPRIVYFCAALAASHSFWVNSLAMVNAPTQRFISWRKTGERCRILQRLR